MFSRRLSKGLPSLYGIQRLCYVSAILHQSLISFQLLVGRLHCDQASKTANAKGADCSQLLPWSNVSLRELLDCSVAAKPGRRVGSLPGRRGSEALEEASYASFSPYDGRAV